ncbi:MAG TPA: bifunctional anthranilate synthase component I family protein/class IV aminotransferase [Solirubrobacteraceae bacterium]|nr:bifunctional anthranilate synthase component I family protein/class IV aminotransferase [Solirubrobacteraceae bacterium]
MSSSTVAARGMQAVRVSLRSTLSPEQAVLWLRSDAHPFALVGEWLRTEAVLGSEPVRVARPDCDPFGLLDESPEIARGEAVVGGGWVGWLGYGLGARIERLPPPPPAPVVRPSFSLAFYDHVVVYDGEQWWFEALWSADREDALRERLALWQERLLAEPPSAREVVTTPFAVAANGTAGHVAAVADCRRRIAEGEILQANLCMRLEAGLDGDLLDLFARALPAAQPRFGALLDGVLSLSPERFLRREGRLVATEPMKGTRPRAGEDVASRAARDSLVGSSKDAAEHVMIVDLMRNDLGRVCEYGSVSVEPARVEAHAGVWQMVSTVSGRLRTGVGDGALLRATFPPGSVTGAPKVQAMKVIATLEATRRELYTGAVGIVSPVAGLELSVAIRTFETHNGSIWFGAGGGIVADSDPELELAEAFTKAAGPVGAIGGRIADAVGRNRGSHAPRTAAPARAALSYGRRPDPARGVFETVLVQHGEPVALGEHLDRLAVSLAELYDVTLDPGAATQARAATATVVGTSRLRILADVDGSLAISVSPERTTSATPLQLTPFAIPGGLGRHKWRDRELLEALAGQAPDTVPLLIDTDGLVLEAAHANVWIVEGGALLTPPADGRILPGVTRAALLAADRSAREEPIDLERLARADAVFLTSSISRRRAARLAV